MSGHRSEDLTPASLAVKAPYEISLTCSEQTAGQVCGFCRLEVCVKWKDKCFQVALGVHRSPCCHLPSLCREFRLIAAAPARFGLVSARLLCW